MPRKSARSILEDCIYHVEKNGMDSQFNCPRFIIYKLAGEDNTRSVVRDLPRDVSAAKALRLLDRAAINDGAKYGIEGPGQYAEGWAIEHPDDPDLFVKALELA